VTDETPLSPLPELPPGPLPEPPPEFLPEPPRRSRKPLAIGLAAALVALAACGGIGYAVLRDDKVAAKPWKAPEPKKTGSYGAESGGSHYGRLGKLLLPIPKNYVPGPDVAEFGNDVELSGKQATALMKDTYRSLPKKQRQAAEKSIDRLYIQGIGMRTYSTYRYSGAPEQGLAVEIRIVQMKNKKAARSATEFYTAFAKATGVFRSGPKIAGHAAAGCFLPPKDTGVELDSMYCQATEGDLLITMKATGTTPFAKDTAADLLKKQLDRVQDPGEAV
jgi:hypothetical protein